MKDFALIKRASYQTFDVRLFGQTNTSNDAATIQAAINAAEAAGGGEVLLQATHKITTGLTIDNHGVVLRFPGGAARGTTVAAGGRLIYLGDDSQPAIYINGGTGGVQGVKLAGFRLENQGTGDVGVHAFNVQNCNFDDVHVREFTADNWLLECDTNASSIYNTWRNCSGWKADQSANGIRMVEGSGKAVNNNLFLNTHFGNNAYGIKQDSDCHDNVFHVIELGGCDIGASIRGRTTFTGANIENCDTYGLELPTGGSASVSGSIHFASNGADINNPDDQSINASMHGGSASAPMAYSGTNAGIGLRGRTPPSAGGINLPTSDGDPVIQRADVTHIEFPAGYTNLSKPPVLPSMTSTQRDALSSPADGTMIYNTTTAQPEIRKAGAWVAIA